MASSGIIDQLIERGYAITRVDRHHHHQEQQLVPPCVTAALEKRWKARSGDTHGEREEIVPDALSLAAYPERAQLRLICGAERWQERTPTHKDASLLHSAAATAAAIMSRTAFDTLGQLKQQLIGKHEDAWEAASLLDAFWYPGEELWESQPTNRENTQSICRAAPMPSPCPAHTDPGLLTLIADDGAALEVLEPDGSWVLVAPSAGEVVLVAGRELAARTRGMVPACTHRVRATTNSRTSIAFEVRDRCPRIHPDGVTHGGGAAVLGAANGNANYARAAASLERLAASNLSTCVIM